MVGHTGAKLFFVGEGWLGLEVFGIPVGWGRKGQRRTMLSGLVRLVFLGCLLVVGGGMLEAAPTSLPGGALEARAQKITERLLVRLNQKNYSEVLSWMSPKVRRRLPLASLRRQMKLVFSITGAYQPRTLRQLSRTKRLALVRFVYRARFAREPGRVFVLFNARLQVEGFVIQTPTLVRRLREERPTPKPPARQWKKLERILNQTLQGYNLGRWSLFCASCAQTMKQVLRPPRFQSFRAALWTRYGRYLSRSFLHSRKTSLSGLLILRYQGSFAKTKNAIIQVVYRQKKGQWRLLAFRLTPRSSRR